MPAPTDDLLLSLQSSLRNALSTFGAQSPQYLSIKYMVDEHAAKLALEGLDISAAGGRDSSSADASR